MTDDLVKELNAYLNAGDLSSGCVFIMRSVLRRAIAALEAKEAERDEVLKEVERRLIRLGYGPDTFARGAIEAMRDPKRPTAEPVKAERRTNPKDRRKSARVLTYGRRFGDRVRWVEQPEPTKQPTLVEWADREKIMGRDTLLLCAELDRLKAERVERDVALLQFDHEYRRERSKNGPFTYDPKNVIAAFNRRNTTKDNGND